MTYIITEGKIDAKSVGTAVESAKNAVDVIIAEDKPNV